MMKRTMKMVYCLVCLCLLPALVWTVQPVLAKEEILIGSHLPLSGIGASVGMDQKWAYDQALKDINKAGGIYVKEYGKKLPVRLVAMDDETDPGKAAAIVERLIKRTKVDLILSGQVGALGVLPGMITAEKFKTYYHGTVIWIPTFLEHNFQWCTMYFFDIGQGATMAYEVWNSLPEDHRPRKPALFMEDTFDGKQMGDGLAALAEKFGYKIALRESMGLGARDFTSQIIKAKAAGVDAILLMANVMETVTLVRQMKENNFSVKFFQGWKGTWATEFWDALGKDAENIMCDGFWSMDFPFPGAKELGARYYNEHGKYSVGIGLYYAVSQILWQAIEKAGTVDGKRIRQAVLDNQFETVMGKVDYDERGVALFKQPDFQWRNGKQMVIYPFEYASAKPQPMTPWDKR